MRCSTLATLLYSTALAIATPVVCLAQPATSDQPQRSFIGTRYVGGSMPDGIMNIGGWVIGDFQAEPSYWLSHVQQGDQRMLWFEIAVGRQGNQAVFEVIDTANLPPMRPDEFLAMVCQINQMDDPELVAIAQDADTAYFTRLSAAWRANRSTGRLEPISTENLRCYNPAWDI